jgi:hypothetical protein
MAMRRALLLAALALTQACSDPDGTASEPPPEPIYPPNFRSRLTLVRDCRLSPAEHDGFYIDVYASAGAARAYNDGEYPFEPGTLLVKGEYDDEDCAQLMRVSAMERLDTGADPKLHDWRWQRTDAQGTVLDQTPARSCAGCHAACEASDFACTEP